jgi:hypothetical protein
VHDHHEHEHEHEHELQHQASFELLSSCLKDALRQDEDNVRKNNKDDPVLALSPELVTALLQGEQEDPDNHELINAAIAIDTEVIRSEDGRENLIFHGIPHRPYYQELSRRILLLHHHRDNQRVDIDLRHDNSPDDHQPLPTHAQESILDPFPRPLLSAQTLNLSEIDASSNIYPLPLHASTSTSSISSSISVSNCIQWLNNLQAKGIRELLCLRTTIGTTITCFPPDMKQLMDAANQPIEKIPHHETKPSKINAKQPILTVAGRARAKHAHRGETDQFFGVSKGNNMVKNSAAEMIIMDLLKDAVWINIHVFGTVEVPIMEVRNRLGYGARWSADWNDDDDDDDDGHEQWCKKPNNILFRGFLEPQMDDGFEKRWRH